MRRDRLILNRRRGFWPDQLAGLHGWLTAEYGVLNAAGAAAGNNEKVATWIDQASGIETMTQGTDALRPTLQTGQFHGRPIVYFNGGFSGQNYLLSGAFAALAESSVAVAYFPILIGGRDSVIVEGDATNKQQLHQNVTYQMRDTVGNIDSGITAVQKTGCTILIAQWAASGASLIEVDGTAVTGAITTSSITGVRLGSSAAGAAVSGYGYIGEYIRCGRNWTAAERAQVRNYLSTKWS